MIKSILARFFHKEILYLATQMHCQFLTDATLDRQHDKREYWYLMRANVRTRAWLMRNA